MNMLFYKARIFVLAMFLGAGGCTSLHTVNMAGDQTAVMRGDTVVVTTQDGRIQKFKVTAVTPEGLRGNQLHIPYSDMKLLQIRRMDTQKTLWLMGIVAAGVIAGSGSDDGDSGY
ncbi:MAG TPA: hypothetical protein VGL10_10205 [Gammaproteobacteria bacterium]